MCTLFQRKPKIQLTSRQSPPRIRNSAHICINPQNGPFRENLLPQIQKHKQYFEFVIFLIYHDI
jgi:hypothetical protein